MDRDSITLCSQLLIIFYYLGAHHNFYFSIVQYVMILLNGGVPIEFAGTEEPAAYGELISIGGLGPSVNGKLSSTIAEIIQTKLSIDSARFYVKFYDVEVSNSVVIFYFILLVAYVCVITIILNCCGIAIMVILLVFFMY